MKKETSLVLADKVLHDTNVIVITDKKKLTQATEVLSRLNQALDAVTADKEKITKPINASLKEIRLKYKPTEDNLNHMIDLIRTEMSRYATVLANEKALASAKIEKRLEAGTLGIVKAVEKLGALESVPEKIEVASGSLQFRPKQVLKITNIDRIPRAFMVVDEGKLLEALKKGDEIEGAELSTV